MKIRLLSIVVLSFLAVSCSTPATEKVTEAPNAESPMEFLNKGHELVYKMVQEVGDYEALAKHKDVVYTYTYQTPDGKTDISTEKYLFDGELSYGGYQQHERTFPDLEGPIEQGYDGHEFWLKHNGEILDDEALLKAVAFKRPTNFYWFAMFQKLLDPGLSYEYLGDKSINNKSYDIVKITFDSDEDVPTDIYQVYINQKTALVDQFLFTVVAHNVVETPLLMTLEYEEIGGLKIPTKRKYKKSTWNADVSDAPWINVSWTDIQFDNGLQPNDFKK